MNTSNTWTIFPLSEIAEVFLGKTPAKSDYTSNGIFKVIKFRDLKEGFIDFNNNKHGFISEVKVKAKSGFRELKVNDVLITSAAHSGENIGKKCALVVHIPETFNKVFFTGELLNIRSSNDLLPHWIYYYFLSAEGFRGLQQAVSGVHLTSGRAKFIPLPLAPFNETRQILTKLDKLVPKVQSCRERLERIPRIMKRFRQSVLAAACLGKLTADWRNVYKKKSCEFIHNEDVSVLSEIPDTWQLQKIGDVAMVKGGKRLPKGSKLVIEDTGFPYIRAGNLKDGSVLGDILFLTPEDHKSISQYTANFGDVYITIVGACIGDAGVIPQNMNGANLTENAAKMCELKNIEGKYLAFVLQSPFLKEIIQESTYSAAQGKLALMRIKELPVPLPPLTEQQEIVHRVESLFNLADQIEAHYQKAKVSVDKLTQSILVKAFRGELAQQDPKDEPASVLLERIKAARNQTGDTTKRRKYGSASSSKTHREEKRNSNKLSA